jgi:hypothetical protein
MDPSVHARLDGGKTERVRRRRQTEQILDQQQVRRQLSESSEGGEGALKSDAALRVLRHITGIATKRIDPAGVFGPHRRVQRIVSARRAQIVSLITTGRAPTCRWRKMQRRPDRFNRRRGVGRRTAGDRRPASPLRTAGGWKNCFRTEERGLPTSSRLRSAKTPLRWEQNFLQVRTAI